MLGRFVEGPLRVEAGPPLWLTDPASLPGTPQTVLRAPTPLGNLEVVNEVGVVVGVVNGIVVVVVL